MTRRAHRGFVVTPPAAPPEVEHRVSVHVLAEAPQFEGHFPGHPVMPAVAELCDLILPEIENAWPDLPALTGAPRMKFARRVAPGDDLELRLWREVSRVRFELTHHEGPCASGTLIFGASS